MRDTADRQKPDIFTHKNPGRKTHWVGSRIQRNTRCILLRSTSMVDERKLTFVCNAFSRMVSRRKYQQVINSERCILRSWENKMYYSLCHHIPLLEYFNFFFSNLRSNDVVYRPEVYWTDEINEMSVSNCSTENLQPLSISFNRIQENWTLFSKSFAQKGDWILLMTTDPEQLRHICVKLFDQCLVFTRWRELSPLSIPRPRFKFTRYYFSFRQLAVDLSISPSSTCFTDTAKMIEPTWERAP